MYPNPQDVLPLPPHPDLDQYRKRAKELAAACRAGEAALLAWARNWIAALDRLQRDTFRAPANELERRALQITHYARQRMAAADCSLSQAQFLIARAHGFESWPRMLEHLERLEVGDSDTATFEQAADAIVHGDLPALQRLVQAHPGLVRARSSREHHGTLLHYVSANGVEHYRQRTPGNIEAIAGYLLDAGAEIDATADVYGGGLTAFALAVTSEHPRAAGIQNGLADVLLMRGAKMPAGIVHYCLENGCPEAAAHLALRGAKVSFIDAAGIGRLDLIRDAFAPPGFVSTIDAGAAMVMAAWSGQSEAVALLLDLGVAVGAVRIHDGQTALHVACYQGNVALVELLLSREAPVDVVDRVYGTPPIVWALHAWLVDNKPDADRYTRILRALIRAGATVRSEQIDDDRLRSNTELYADLQRAISGSKH